MPQPASGRTKHHAHTHMHHAHTLMHTIMIVYIKKYFVFLFFTSSIRKLYRCKLFMLARCLNDTQGSLFLSL